MANILAAEWCTSPETNGVFNVGGGYNYTVKEIADMISPKQTYIPPRPGEARETLADITKAKTILKWNPMGNLERYIKGLI
jgi:nucleoside-diphosphate-sugar epimerase